MKVKYHQETDALSVRLSDAEILESEEVRPGIIFDLDKDGRIVGFEILDATDNVSHSDALIKATQAA